MSDKNDRWLGLAAFVHYAVKKKYKFSKNGETCLVFWLENGKYHPFKITIDPKNEECGCVYTNTEDLNTVFGKNVNSIVPNCKRWGPLLEETDPHCTLEESKWGKISTVIDNSTGETADCLRNPV